MVRGLNRLGAVIGLLVVLTACLPVTSKSPIGTTVGYKVDPQLTGLWKDAEKSWTTFTFFPQPDGSTKAVMLIPPTPDDKGGWIVFDVRTTTLGSYQYMDVTEIESNGLPPDQKLTHVPVLYRTGSDGSLALYLMNEDAVKDAIKAGTIAGVAEPGDFGDVVLTATPPALDALLQTPAGRALFNKPSVILKRLSP